MHVQFELYRCYILYRLAPRHVRLCLTARYNSTRVTRDGLSSYLNARNYRGDALRSVADILRKSNKRVLNSYNVFNQKYTKEILGLLVY